MSQNGGSVRQNGMTRSERTTLANRIGGGALAWSDLHSCPAGRYEELRGPEYVPYSSFREWQISGKLFRLQGATEMLAKGVGSYRMYAGKISFRLEISKLNLSERVMLGWIRLGREELLSELLV